MPRSEIDAGSGVLTASETSSPPVTDLMVKSEQSGSWQKPSTLLLSGGMIESLTMPPEFVRAASKSRNSDEVFVASPPLTPSSKPVSEEPPEETKTRIGGTSQYRSRCGLHTYGIELIGNRVIEERSGCRPAVVKGHTTQIPGNSIRRRDGWNTKHSISIKAAIRASEYQSIHFST